MKKYTADLDIWKKVNTHLNAAALLSDVYNVNHIQPNESTVTFISENPPEISKQHSRGNALALISNIVSVDVFLDVIHRSYTQKGKNIFVYDKFDVDDKNTIAYPLLRQDILNAIPDYCNKLYKDKFDFRLTPEQGFHEIDLILKIEGDNWDKLMEDISFLTLKDSDINELYNYKIKNMIPFEEFIDEEELQQGEL